MHKLRKLIIPQMLLAALFLSFLTICLTACSGLSFMNPDNLGLDKTYNLNANIQHGELNAAAQLMRSSTNMWEIKLTEPFALEGLTMTYDNGEITSSFKDMETTLDNSMSVISCIVGAFESAIDGEGREIISSGEEIHIRAKTKSSAQVSTGTDAAVNSYEFILNKKSLEPLSLSIPEIELSVTFSKIQPTQSIRVMND